MKNNAFNKTVEQKVIKFIKEYNLIKVGDRILISLSGGPDSVFLLNFLVKYQNKYKIELGAFHLNHLLRKDSKLDQEFSARICSQLRIPFFTVNKKVRQLSRKNKISLEEAGRNLRYKYLKQFADKYSYNKIATAHNLDDNAETVLLNLIKGKGLKAIAGIKIKNQQIIRPIMCLSKSEIEKYLQLNDMGYIKDPSNQDEIFNRNFLRLKIVPLIINSLNENLSSTIFQTSKILSEFVEYFDNVLEEKYNQCVSSKSNSILLDLNSFSLEKKIIKTEVLKKILFQELKLEPTYSRINEILNLVNLQSGKKVILSDQYEAIKDKNLITFSKIEERNKINIKVKVGQLYNINNLKISVKKAKEILLNNNPSIEIIDADKIIGDLVIRNWNEGDKFIPLGMKGHKKISDFLTDMKISSLQKEKVLILIDQEKIISVLGFRIDDRVKISKNSKNFYMIEIRNEK